MTCNCADYQEIHCTNLYDMLVLVPNVSLGLTKDNVESKSASPHGDANGRWAGTR
jgi:hypothetical protein